MRWIKVNWTDQIVSLGDEKNYWTPGYQARYEEYLQDGGEELQPADEGWDGYTYETGKGLFRWKNGGKEFISKSWPVGDSYVGRYNKLIQYKLARSSVVEKQDEENVNKDISEAEQLKQDIAKIKKILNVE